MIRHVRLARAAAAVALLVSFGAVALSAVPARAQRAPNTLLRRVAAPGGGFTLLLPEGWSVEADSGAGVDVRARTADGRVSLSVLAARGEDLGGGPAPAARHLLGDALARETHPAARNLRVTEPRPLTELARVWERRLAQAEQGAGVACEAAAVTLEYEEDGVLFRERLCGVVESGPQRWRARLLFAARTPASEWASREPVLSHVLGSFTPRDASGADLARDALALALPGESRWRNPFSGELDRGSFHFGRYRWVTPDGDEVWSFNETFNPNAAPLLGRADWQKSLPQ